MTRQMKCVSTKVFRQCQTCWRWCTSIFVLSLTTEKYENHETFFWKSICLVACCLLLNHKLYSRWYSVDVELVEGDVHPLLGPAPEEVVALRVSRVQPGEVGRSEAAVAAVVAVEVEAAHCAKRKGCYWKRTRIHLLFKLNSSICVKILTWNRQQRPI